MDELALQERKVDTYVDRGDKEAAVKLLFELITKYVEIKNFRKAEALRDKLFEVDPMALSEIIRSAELIEEEKAQSIDKDHLEVWTKLYSTLTAEEANALFYSMERIKIDTNQALFRQGTRNSNLFFINHGLLNLIVTGDAKEDLLSTLGPGDIAGEDTFFTDSLCTTSLVALSRGDVSFLKRSALAQWTRKYPLLESKLTEFCSEFERIQDVLKKRSLDRRVFIRTVVEGRGVFQLLNSAGNPIGKAFKGDLFDVSCGGLCFLLRITKRETSRMLLGQRIHMNLGGAVGSSSFPPELADLKGLIVAVCYHPLRDSSIHVRFDEVLPERSVEGLINLLKPREKSSEQAS